MTNNQSVFRKYLVDCILDHPNLELAFVWNRTPSVMQGKVEEGYILTDLAEFVHIEVDLIVEVAHPSISMQYGPLFLQHADYMMGSPTALADRKLETTLRKLSAEYSHAVYIPSGAFWGGEDIRKMADMGTLLGLNISMTKHPSSFKLLSPLMEKNENVVQRTVLYEGPVRELCRLAPNNVNTMAAGAVAAHNLGFDGVQGSIISDPNLPDWHVVEVQVTGPTNPKTDQTFTVKTVRQNPSQAGSVTGSATFKSFFSSILGATGKDSGFHLC
ncbi:PREDICTED: putative L-aspartate dehydrogenase isoform X2 [Priapulus caudatus]|uniref:Aspartate dehydrogenase domain-containing protein n=1 Tax=Priapulus caudatus TaxID=37621 RepID=A0ABM1E4S4_PRICU|nr:PREDICTED: putative L-aspartate dehydrogenase isoform X2 [Priapulus caudatus]